jgi:hypothetical protein
MLLGLRAPKGYDNRFLNIIGPCFFDLAGCDLHDSDLAINHTGVVALDFRSVGM